MEENQQLSRHELKKLKKEQREEERKKEESIRNKKYLTKKIRNYSIIAVIILGIIYLIYLGVSRSNTNNDTSLYDLSGIPSGQIHWHADIDVIICGEDIELPYGPVGSHIGTGLSHTHDKATNLGSMPSSDGNGVMHLEGNVRLNPSQSTLIQYMRNIGIKFSETEIMEKKNGDLCNDIAGQVNVYVNGEKLDNIIYYIPRDNDKIEIKFE